MTSWVDPTPGTVPRALPILSHLILTTTLKDICKTGIIGVCEETKICRVENLPGPSAHGGKAEVHTEARLSLEPIG